MIMKKIINQASQLFALALSVIGSRDSTDVDLDWLMLEVIRDR